MPGESNLFIHEQQLQERQILQGEFRSNFIKRSRESREESWKDFG